VYSRGYGMANLETGSAITPASIFHVASISKQFAAFSVALLAEDGKLSLDDVIQKYLPEIPVYARPITIRHLIHHTSGLRDQWSLLGMADWRDDDLITENDVLSIVSRQKEINFLPGDEYIYSNTGYTLLGTIVKRVSGKSLREFSDERIFQPLGMTSTHFHDDHTMVVPGRTSAYEPRPGGGWAVSIPVFDTYGATSLFTTVADLLKWEQNFAEPKVGSRGLIEKAQQPTTLTSGRPLNYGYGLSIETYRGVRGVGHGGADAGYRSDVVRFPDSGLAVAVLCNASNSGPGGLARKVADILLEKQLAPGPPRRRRGRQRQRPRKPAPGWGLSPAGRRWGGIHREGLASSDCMPFNIPACRRGGLVRRMARSPGRDRSGRSGPAIRRHFGTEPVGARPRPQVRPTLPPSSTPTPATTTARSSTWYAVARKDSVLTVTLRRRGTLDFRPMFPMPSRSRALAPSGSSGKRAVTSFRVTQAGCGTSCSGRHPFLRKTI
jgi:CubicO group peptidase (beta-lactamase class C family)